MTDHPDLGRLVCLTDLERAAADAVEDAAWQFAAGGSGAELTLAANRRALDQVWLTHRVLTGSGDDPNTATVLAGSAVTLPAATAPMAYQRLFHPDGELAAARAAAAAGVPFTVSTISSTTVEEITATGAITWWQQYWLRDHGLTLDLVRRAEAAGCTAIMVTVDVPVMGLRRRDARTGFTLPPHISAVHLGQARTTAHDSSVAAHTGEQFEPALRWADLRWLRERTSLPLIVKGVLDPRDAVLAADCGADAVVVSNHGGRQLDGALPTALALPPVVDAVGDRCQVLIDGAILGGADVLKCLALGASGVLIGRPILWGLAAGGQAGVRRVLDIVRAELHNSMALAGCADVPSAARLRVAHHAPTTLR